MIEPRASGTLASGASDAELASFVARSLGTGVDELVRRPVPQSSFPCEVLTVRSGARDRELFFKDFGSCRLPRASSAGPAREIEVYRRLLDPEALGTPRHVGSLLEPGRAWLLLENLRAAPLARGDRGAWIAAAAWPARLQALGLPADASFLAVHDAAHLQATVQEAVQAVASVDLVLEHELQNALEDHEAFAEQLADQERVLVHGSYRPENILVDAGVSPARIAPVDWEYAALGSPLHDLAFLTAGKTRAKAELLFGAFSEACRAHGRRVPAGAEAWELLSILRLHKFLRSLGRAQAWAYPRETVAKLVGLVGQTSLELRAARAERGRSRSALPGLEDGPHPALRAWRSLGHPPAGPARVERIQGRFFSRKGRVVYRLGAIGPGGLAVVAKRCQPKTVALERFAYAELLPRFGADTPQHFGWVPDGGSGWLFLEDVGAERLDPSVAEQRALALDWLARLHLASHLVAGHAPALPDRGPRGYLELLAEARRVIDANLANPALSEAERGLLRGVLERCDRVETGWERVAAVCAGMPPTYVHGDFRPKNLFLQRDGGELRLRTIDWEYSGWGVPASDLGSLLRDHGQPPELAGYRRAIEPLAPGLDEARLWEWVLVGRVMRAVASIHWTRNSLAYPFVDKPVRNLCEYADAMERAFDELGAHASAGRAGP